MSQCVLEGNPDLYGIGVRVGLYTQWVAQLLTTIFQPKGEKETRVVSLIVQSSLFLGMCTESTNGDDNKVGPVGAVITQLLLCGSLSSLTSKGLTNAGGLSALFRCLFYIALSSYGIWFWFVGVDKMPVANCEIEDQIVFFRKVTIMSGFRTFGQVFAVLGLVACLLILISPPLYRKLKGGPTPEPGPSNEPAIRPQIEILLLIISVALLGISIGLIEYLVNVNKIDGLSDVNSVGQFLPLLVGAISLFQALSSLVFGEKVFNRCWFIGGYHLGLKKNRTS